MGPPTTSPRHVFSFLSPKRRMQCAVITEDPEGPTYLPPTFLRREQTDVDSSTNKVHAPDTQPLSTAGHTPPRVQHVSAWHAELSADNHCFHTVPLEQLQVLFTFFSKFFSPFVHTTSSLSVSQEYLALDEIYHLFRAAIPNNPTREKLDTYWTTKGDAYGVLTLSDALFQRTYSRLGSPVTRDPKTTIRRTIMLSDFKFELCPLHSPLLRASLLVSFPPVNNMLKSTG